MCSPTLQSGCIKRNVNATQEESTRVSIIFLSTCTRRLHWRIWRSRRTLHPNYLSALFRREVGRTLQDYIRDAKIEEAANLLRLTDRPISEVSTLLGFHDQSYFTKTFKKVMGVTPKRFKRGQSSSADRI
ncbi:helix-turn-helix transcriptional regulator [Paenibacillus sp. P25]|nr:helix-turn-helix transcriptional regulator [Paenibacillus sp. P25]